MKCLFALLASILALKFVYYTTPQAQRALAALPDADQKPSALHLWTQPFPLNRRDCVMHAVLVRAKC